MDIQIAPTDRPVYRVKIMRPGWPASFRYFTTPGQAAKFAAWQLVMSRHKIYDRSYKVHGVECECAEPGFDEFSPTWEICPLHDHRNGYYARMHKRLMRMLLQSLEPNAEQTDE